ncbi:MAG: DNA-binding protein AraC-type [Gammaproteobacteria bacterium]|jgi:hypothetical protein|nr:DNA-binding protein AraC-type [Gammaproteobacteria bacterium]
MATHQRSDASVSVSSYREFAPSVLLRQDVLCLWTQSISGSAGEYAQRVLPDGCIDIVLINGEPPDVVGPWTKPFVARLPPGTMIVGARFHPGHAPGLLGLPASRLLNQSVPLCSHTLFQQHIRHTGAFPADAAAGSPGSRAHAELG